MGYFFFSFLFNYLLNFLSAMKNLLHLFLLLANVLACTSNSMYANPKKPFSNDDDRFYMVFGGYGAFVERAVDKTTKESAVAPGIFYNYMAGWGMGEGEPKTFDGGGYIRIAMGYSLNRDFNFVPYDYSTGAYGSYTFSKNHELGYDWGMLGIYAYSTKAFFGSKFSLKYRFNRFQVDAMRGADGIFFGFIKPRFQARPVHSIGLGYLFKNGYMCGLRYTASPTGIDKHVGEYRLTFSVGL